MPETDLDARTRLTEILWNDPEAKADMQKHIARKFPNGPAAMPDYTARVEGQKTVAEVKQIVAADKAERAAERNAAELEKARRSIIDDPELRIRPDEIEAVEKLMLEETIGSHRAAARLHRAQQTVATPRSDTSMMQIPGVSGAGGDEYKGLVENPDAWGRSKAHEILNDFRKGQGSKWE